MKLQKKESKKQSQKLKYELWIHIVCPECEKNGEIVMIAIPLANYPEGVRCFSCGSYVRIKNILKEGIEIRRK